MTPPPWRTASGATAPAAPVSAEASRPTVVHLLRHGEVDNPSGVLYGRLPGYHLSPLGLKMAERIAEWAARRDVVRVVASPLERAQETAVPIAAALGLSVDTDDRLVEAENVFEGHRFGVGDGALRQPATWQHLWNPFRPSWGEPYRHIALRVISAVADARAAAAGHEVVLVSHQLPIWVTRSFLSGRRLWHDPRARQCALASVTSLHYADGQLTRVDYAEPAGDLVPRRGRRARRRFRAGA